MILHIGEGIPARDKKEVTASAGKSEGISVPKQSESASEALCLTVEYKINSIASTESAPKKYRLFLTVIKHRFMLNYYAAPLYFMLGFHII